MNILPSKYILFVKSELQIYLYLDKNYPQYKKEWDFNKSITNYNL